MWLLPENPLMYENTVYRDLSGLFAALGNRACDHTKILLNHQNKANTNPPAATDMALARRE